MFSLITGARAGITFRNSGSEALRQPATTGAPRHNTQINKIVLINSSSPASHAAHDYMSFSEC
jgi:hypothetical protein